MPTAAPPGWTYRSAPRLGSPGVQVEYWIGFTVGAGLNNVRCTPTSTSCTTPATGPSKPLSQPRVEENHLVTAMVASLGAVGADAAPAEAIGADAAPGEDTSAPTATPGTSLPAAAATRAGVNRSDAAAADTGAAAAGWFARTARDVTAADRPGPAVRTAATDLDAAAAPPGAAVALLETRAEEVSAPADVSSACAVPAPARASPTPTAPAPSHA